jgi:hypothetical protein
MRWSQRQYDRALTLYSQGLETSQHVGDKRIITNCLEGLAGVVCALKQPGRAVRLLGAAAELRDALKMPLAPTDRTLNQATVECVRAQLDEATYASAFAEGRALTLEQAVALALQEG